MKKLTWKSVVSIALAVALGLGFTAFPSHAADQVKKEEAGKGAQVVQQKESKFKGEVVSEDGKKFSLKAEDGTIYQLEGKDLDKAVGKKVTIIGTLNSEKKVITVKELHPEK